MAVVDLLVIQPTPFCNINCSYCYLPDRNNSQKITISTIERVIDSLIEDRLLDTELSIVWHAGEPLVLPPSFYQPLFEAICLRLEPLGISINHSIQTNSTLISQEWCDFINEKSIKIGISIDGPQHIHDSNRKTRSGKGTFENVMKGVELLRKNNISYHAIAVVTESSINSPESFFQFFYNNGFYHLGLNIEEIEGVHQSSSVFLNALYENVVNFYEQLFDLYIMSDRHMGIREFDGSMNAILRSPHTLDIRKLETKSHQNTPMAIISVDYQGNFSTFSPELIGQPNASFNNFIFGNISNDNFVNPQRKDLLEEIDTDIKKGIQKCKNECEYFHICGGGAPANKFFENGTFNSSETNYCKYNIKVPTDIVLSYLEKKLLAV